MRNRLGPIAVGLLLGLLVGMVPPAGLAAGPPRPAAAIRALYDRLEPGMTLAEVAAAADRPQLLRTAAPVTTWVVWSPSTPGAPTSVLRASFREARLSRIEYESFGDAYRHRVKDAEGVVELSGDELRRLSSRAAAAADCRAALDAYHRLVARIQERLTPEEQAAWVRALLLRRAVGTR